MILSELIKVLEAKLKKDGDIPIYVQTEHGQELPSVIMTCSASNNLPRRLVIA